METSAINSSEVSSLVNPGQLCRLCALPTPDMTFIYGDEGVEEDLASKINLWLPVSVSQTDTLPKQVCATCIHQLRKSVKFSISVLRAEHLLRELLASQSLGFVETAPMPKPSSQTSSMSTDYSCPLCCEGVMAALQGGVDSAENIETSDGEFLSKFSPDICDILESSDEDHFSVSDVNTRDTIESVDAQCQENKLELYQCRICNEHSSTLEELVFHSLQVHANSNTNFYPCVLCDRICGESSNLVRHCSLVHRRQVLKQIVDSLLMCSVCGGKFISQGHLLGHRCELMCKECDLAFGKKEELDIHSIVHEQKKEVLLACEWCEISFSDAGSLHDHINKVHSKYEPKEAELFTCECGRSYQNRSAYQIHLRRHRFQHLFKCDVCSKSFQDKQTLKEHLTSHMSVKPFQCHVCGKYLNRLSRLRKHLMSHEVETVEPQTLYCCSNCSQAFSCEDKAVAHLQNASDGCWQSEGILSLEVNILSQVFRCEYCERCFSTHDSLNHHRRQHKEPRVFACSVCKAEFSSYSRVQTHKVGKTLCQNEEGFRVPKMFGCDDCYKSYLHWTYLAVHRKLQHADIKPRYKCKICDAAFPNSWSVAYHRKTRHPDEEGGGSLAKRKPFKCELCGRRYVSEVSLNNHQALSHDVETGTSFQCEECGKVFSRKVSLESHLRCHSGLKPYACKICSKQFVHPSGLSAHMRRHKGDMPHSCRYCEKKFLQRSDCADHERKHTGERPWTCDTCSKSFRTRAMWFEHSRIHRDERPFPCDICGVAFRRSYALKNHRMIHTGEKNFVCKACGHAFRMKQDLQKHERLRHRVKETSQINDMNTEFI